MRKQENNENLSQQAIKNLQAILKENEDLHYQFTLAYKVLKDTEEKLTKAEAEIKILKSKKTLPKPNFSFIIN